MSEQIAKRYTDEQREQALGLLAMYGSPQRVSDELEIPAATISAWKKTHAERFAEIRVRYAGEVQKKLAAEHEDVAALALEKERQTLDALDVSRLAYKDMANTAAKLAYVASTHSDKARAARDMPTHIIEHKSAEDSLDSMRKRYPHLIVDGEAEELTDAEVVP